MVAVAETGLAAEAMVVAGMPLLADYRMAALAGLVFTIARAMK